MLLGEPVRDGRQLLDRLLPGYARSEPGDGVVDALIARRRIGIDAERRPDLGPLGPGEAVLHDADDAMRAAVDPQVLPDRCWIAAETLAPERLRDERYGGRLSGKVLILRE